MIILLHVSPQFFSPSIHEFEVRQKKFAVCWEALRDEDVSPLRMIGGFSADEIMVSINMDELICLVGSGDF